MTRFTSRIVAPALAVLLIGTLAPAPSQAQTGKAAVEASATRIIAAASHSDIKGIMAEWWPDGDMRDGIEYFANAEAIRVAYTPVFGRVRSQNFHIERSNVTMLSPTAALYAAIATFL